jgi:hypothetical protein
VPMRAMRTVSELMTLGRVPLRCPVWTSSLTMPCLTVNRHAFDSAFQSIVLISWQACVMTDCAPCLLLLHDQTVGDSLNEATELLPHTETAMISLPFFLATAWHTGTSLCYEPMTD